VDFLSGSVVYNQETGKNDTSGLKLKNTIEFVNLTFMILLYIAKKDLPAVDADQLFNLSRRSIYFGNYYAVSKSMGKSKCKSKSYLNQ
jgi:peptidyl-prolyl cis-trans isomerase D